MNAATTFQVNVGADGRWHYVGTDYEEAHRVARELSERGPIFQGQVFSSRSGKIHIYRDGETHAFLDSTKGWVVID